MLSSKLCSWMFSLMEYSLLMVNIITLLNYAQSLQSRKWCPGNEWGGSQPQEGSTELSVPQGSQMHLQQIWTLRHNWEVWWPLHSLTQHNQWKGKNIITWPPLIIFLFFSDLCFALVLVCVPVHCLCIPAYLESIIHNIKENKRIHPSETDSWVCSGKTTTYSSLDINCPSSARACCHLLCQAEHGWLVHPPAGGRECWCPRLCRPREANWHCSQKDAWYTSRHF